MPPFLPITELSLPDIQRCVEAYPHAVPEKVRHLEERRFVGIPEAIAKRAKEGKKCMDKPELEALMQYKLTRGTFRPSLMSLITANSEPSVIAVTTRAFAKCAGQIDFEQIGSAIKELTELKGVGPATASLILSVYDPVGIPFFADELFMYCTNAGIFASEAPKKSYKIKYTMKEYEELLLQTHMARTRLDAKKPRQGKVSALDLEMTAYVLAHAPHLVGKLALNPGMMSQESQKEDEGQARSTAAIATGDKRDIADDGTTQDDDKPLAKRRRTSREQQANSSEPVPLPDPLEEPPPAPETHEAMSAADHPASTNRSYPRCDSYGSSAPDEEVQDKLAKGVLHNLQLVQLQNFLGRNDQEWSGKRAEVLERARKYAREKFPDVKPGTKKKPGPPSKKEIKKALEAQADDV